MKLNEEDVIYTVVETLGKQSRLSKLTYVDDVATTIALTAKKDTIVVTKSTAPVGTNDRLLQIIDHNKLYHINVEVVSNLVFLNSLSLNKIEHFGYDCASVERRTLKPHLHVSLGRG